MLLRYLDDILDVIDSIKTKDVVFKQHSFIEACYYYNDAIANSLKKIKDEYKNEPSCINSLKDIELKLLLDQMDQLYRDFSFEEKERKKLIENKTFELNELKKSFEDFVAKASQTIKEIEFYINSFGLDIKIIYSVDTYYFFEEIYEQLQNDLQEDSNCFELPENEKFRAPMQNLISKRFWLDNFGETMHIDFVEFFEKFKNYVFETEKTNIDETHAEYLRKHLDITRNLKVFQRDWNTFFNSSWSNFDFRKLFLMPKEDKQLNLPLENLKLNYLYEGVKAEENKKENEIDKTYQITAKQYYNGKEFVNKDILSRPVIFGRSTRTFNPDVNFCGKNDENKSISNKQFQILAYNNYKGDEGYYISDLSLTNHTSLEIAENQTYVLDEGSLFEISQQFLTVTKISHRYKEEDDPLGPDWFHVPTHVGKPNSEINNIYNNKDKPYIALNFVDIDEKVEFEADFNSEKYSLDIYNEGDDLYFVDAKEKKETSKEKRVLCGTIKFENNKWILRKAPKQNGLVILMFLINNEEYQEKQISWGCKLKNNMKINCSSHTFKVNLNK